MQPSQTAATLSAAALELKEQAAAMLDLLQAVADEAAAHHNFAASHDYQSVSDALDAVNSLEDEPGFGVHAVCAIRLSLMAMILRTASLDPYGNYLPSLAPSATKLLEHLRQVFETKVPALLNRLRQAGCSELFMAIDWSYLAILQPDWRR